MRKVVVIAPTYNENGSIKNLIETVFDQSEKLPNWEINLLIVDSYSNDGTVKTVKAMQKKYPHLYLLETAKEGLGKAYLQAFKYCEKHIDPYLVMQIDADGQHDPRMIPNFIKKIEEGADFVVGTRYAMGGSIPSNWGLHRKILSIGANLVVKYGFMKPKVTEWTNGYRAIKFWLAKKAYDHLKNYSGYVFQVAFLDFAIKNNAVLGEIPVHFQERKSGISKINALQYSSQTFFYVLTHSSFIKYFIVGITGSVLDFGISYLAIEKLRVVIWLSTILSTETAIVNNFLLNNFWSFSHKKIKGGLPAYLSSFLKFNLVSSGAVLIQVVGIQILVLLFGKKLWYFYKVFLILFIVIPYSYIFYNKFIWKSK